MDFLEISFLIVVFLIIFYFFNKNNWYELNVKKVPRWVLRASNKYYNSLKIRPYDVVKYFKGKNHIYRVEYRAIAQSTIEEHYFVKTIKNKK